MADEAVWNFAAWCVVVLLYISASRYNRPSTTEVQARETFAKPFIIWSGPVQILMLLGQSLLAIAFYLIWSRGGWASNAFTLILLLSALLLSSTAQHIFWTRDVFGIPAFLTFLSLLLLFVAVVKASVVIIAAGVLVIVFIITNIIPLSVYFTVMWHKKPNFADIEQTSPVNMSNNANAYVFAQDPEPHIILGPPTIHH